MRSPGANKGPLRPDNLPPFPIHSFPFIFTPFFKTVKNSRANTVYGSYWVRSCHNYGRFRTKLTIQECGSRTRDPDCKRFGVQPDRPVGNHRPVCLCIVYVLRGDPHSLHHFTVEDLVPAKILLKSSPNQTLCRSEKPWKRSRPTRCRI
jgi:hypothetical protein